MSAVMRPYLTAGVALAGASVIAVTPVEPVMPLPKPLLANLGVHLTAGEGDFSIDDLLNVPVNLLHDMINIPYYLFSAPYSVDSLIPNFTTDDQHVPGSGDLPDGEEPGTAADHYDDPSSAWPLYNGPYDDSSDPDVFHGAINNLAGALDYTGSWYESVPTNVWGWDTANTWNFPAVISLLTPWAYDEDSVAGNPIADNFNQLMEAESPIASMDNKFFFHDPIGELTDQFQVPMDELTGENGYDLPEALNPVGSEADPLGDGGYPYHEIWDGPTAHVDSDLGFGQFFDSLTDDPADNPIQLPDPDDIYPSLVHMYEASNVDFSPFDPGTDSFFFQAASDVFGAPAIINGLINGDHGLDPGAPDLIPDSVSQPLGDALDSAIGPDTEFAHVVSDFAGRTQDLSEGMLNVFLPESDPAHETPTEVLSQVFSPGYVNASQTEIQDVLSDYADNHDGVSFGGDADSYESNLALVLAGNSNTEILGGNVSADDVSEALAHSGIDNYDASGADYDPSDIA